MSSLIAKVADGLQNIVAGLGTSRDKHSYTNYAPTVPLNNNELELNTLFRDSWLAKKIINSVTEDMVREWFKVTVDDQKDFDFCQMEKRWKLRPLVENSIRWSRLYGLSYIIIGTRGQELSEELGIVKKDSISFIKVMDCYRVSPGSDIDYDIESPNFDLPTTYTISTGNLQKTVHWTRVIRVEGQAIPNQAWLQNNRKADSELQHSYESIKSYDGIKASIVSMFYEANVDILKVEGLTELLSTRDGEAKIIRRFQNAATLKSFNRLFLIGADETYEKKSNNFSNISEIWKGFATDVSGSSEIPTARLFGVSPGGLGSTGKGELVNYYDMVSNKQKTDLMPILEQLIGIIVANSTGTIPKFEIEFNPLMQVSETDIATVEKTNADRDNIYLSAGIVTPAEVGRELMAKKVYSGMTDESIALLEELESVPDTEENEDLTSPSKSKPKEDDNV
jgi:phage-related protein (TIGR01555 family)